MMLPTQPAKPKTVRVEVTAEDIDMGIRRNQRWCPIAMAITRATGREWLIGGRCGLGVYRYTIRSRSSDPNALSGAARLPEVAQAFAAAFDEGRSVAPITFYVDLELPA